MFNQQNLYELQQLLPFQFAGVVAIIGVEKAFKLVALFGGTSFPIGKNKYKRGKALHFCLAQHVGEECATRIETALDGQRELYIPKCEKIMLELRNREIRRQFDELTTRPNYPLTATMAANNLAREYGLCKRHIDNIVNTADVQPSAVQYSLL